MTATERWKNFQRDHSRGERITGSISKITDYGLIVDLVPGIFGIVHLNDLDGNDAGIEALEQYSVGDTVDTLILTIEPERERVCLGIKQIHNWTSFRS